MSEKKLKPLDLFARPSPKQLWLRNFENPLTARFGAAFFAQVPKAAGVYCMRNERGEILYVGKAKNLRNRLRSYTHVNVENASRKVLRLVQLVRAIEWEEWPDEKSALLRENHLLRTLRPSFNVANTAPHTYLFAHLRLDEDGIVLHFASALDPSYPEIYGVFKGLGLTYHAHKALLRLFWMSHRECRNGYEVPAIYTHHRKLQHTRLPLREELGTREKNKIHDDLKRFLSGTSRALLTRLFEELLAREELAAFTRELIQADLETLVEFYERCCRRNHRLKKEFRIQTRLIAQDEIDDLLVLARRD
jgi:excinuclease UvrABC nuclease subunit